MGWRTSAPRAARNRQRLMSSRWDSRGNNLVKLSCKLKVAVLLMSILEILRNQPKWIANILHRNVLDDVVVHIQPKA